MKKIKYIIIVLMLVLLTTACGLNTGTRNFKSKNGILQVTTNGSWTEAKAGSLNSRAELELRSLRIERYVMALTEPASNFDSYEDWLSVVVYNNSQNYSFDSASLEDVEIAGFNSKYVDFNTLLPSDDPYNTENPNINMFIRIYFIGSKNYYTQLFMWTLDENKESSIVEFEKIVDSLKILK